MFRILNRPRVKRGRRLRAGAAGGISAIALTAGLAWTVAPAAQASGSFYEVAFQSSSGLLATVGTQNHGAWSNRPIMPGTSPSIAALGNPVAPSGFEAAYQDTAGDLITFGPDGTTDRGSMASGTSPSITGFADSTSAYEVAFQVGSTEVDTVSSAGVTAQWGEAAFNTSPSIASLAGGGFEVAFQGIFGNLVTEGADNHGPWDLGMAADTSPSITALASSSYPDGSYEVAFQANTGSLWVTGASGQRDWNLGMMAGTSPSIIGLANGGAEIAFQANTGSLWTVGADNHDAWNLDMMTGTSPSITGGPTSSEYEVAFQANSGQVWTVGADDHDAWTPSAASGTNPSIAP